MSEVLLVSMPYASLEKPALALSILKAVLRRNGIASKILYPNLDFGAEIGPHLYSVLSHSYSHCLAGEWTFAGAAFPEFESDTESYMEHIVPGLRALANAVSASPDDMRQVLEYVRLRGTAFVDRTAQHIVDRKPRVVGCSSTFQQHCPALALLRRIKALDPSIVTLLGGANCEASMGLATHRECPWVDVVVSGEAEELLPGMLHSILEAEPGEASLETLEMPVGAFGPMHRKQGYESLLGAPPRISLEDMKSSPMPEYEDYFETLLQSPLASSVKPGLLAETSRGCWWGAVSHCTFCGLNGGNMQFRSKAPEKVVEEFNTLSHRHGVQGIQVVDNILDMKYMKSVLPALADQQQGYEIFYETKSNLDRDQVRLLARAGVRWIQPGIESFDGTILKAIAKGTTGTQNLQLLKYASESGVYLEWILLYDIPGETDDLYLRMAEWLPKVFHFQPPSATSFIQFNRFSPYHSYPERFGLRLSPDRAYSFVFPWSRQSLDEFAYYFDDYSQRREQIHGDSDRGLSRPGLRRVREAIERWNEEWSAQQDPATPTPPGTLLYSEAAGDTLVVTDTRSCAVRHQYRLQGLERQVYEWCDRAQTRSSLEKLRNRHAAEESTDALHQALERLTRWKLILFLEEKWLSLGTLGKPQALPPMNLYPGGRIRSQQELAQRQAAHA